MTALMWLFIAIFCVSCFFRTGDMDWLMFGALACCFQQASIFHNRLSESEGE